jgi:hypothetical protein
MEFLSATKKTEAILGIYGVEKEKTMGLWPTIYSVGVSYIKKVKNK